MQAVESWVPVTGTISWCEWVCREWVSEPHSGAPNREGRTSVAQSEPLGDSNAAKVPQDSPNLAANARVRQLDANAAEAPLAGAERNGGGGGGGGGGGLPLG